MQVQCRNSLSVTLFCGDPELRIPAVEGSWGGVWDAADFKGGTSVGVVGDATGVVGSPGDACFQELNSNEGRAGNYLV